MPDDSAELERLRKELGYYKRQLNELAGANLQLDYALPALRHELKQKREGFALLSQLQQSVGAQKQISLIFELTISAINATLGMDRTVVLVPTERALLFRPTQWTGFREDFAHRFSSLTLDLPREVSQGSGILLVNRATPRTELIDRISSSFETPFLVAVPVMGENVVIGVILCGRLSESPPFWPALDQGDVDTLRAIAGLISATVKNMRVAVLEETDRLKTEFFANISHEFRTPITLTLGPLEQILSGSHGALAPEQRAQLEVMLRNQERLLGLVNQILDLAKLEAGKMNMRAARVSNLNQFIEERAAAFRAAAGKPRVDLRLSLDPRVAAAELYIDRDKFDKLLANLLSNAYKFTREGFIEVATQVLDGNLRLTVTDSGIGIKEDQLPHIFDRFRQADASASREFGGTGLGLALVKEVAKLHRGDVVAYSQFGKGSSFQVTIPTGKAHLDPSSIVDFEEETIPAAGQKLAPIIESEGSAEDVEALNREAESMFDAAKATVLYAEDNRDLRRYVRSLLQADYNVFVAADGQDGLERAQQHAPDLIVTDFMMPKVSGREFLRAIRNDPVLQRLPVIFLTARAGATARLESLQAGADDYLTKPFDQGELLARVRNLLRARSLERELEVLNRRLETRIEHQMAELIRSGELRRFLPPSVVDSVLSGKVTPSMAFQRRKITVLFAGIAGFPTLSESLEPEDLSSLLNEYLREMAATALENRGTIDTIVGDAVMVLFGAPEEVPVEQQVSAALETARRMRARARELQPVWRRYGASQVKLQIGVNTGYCTVGVFGSDLLRSYTAVGAPLINAAKLQQQAAGGSILIGLPAYALGQDQVRDARGPLTLAGTSGALEYYEILDAPEEAAIGKPQAAAAEPLRPGLLLEHFKVISRLGAGGMGVVYLAEDTQLGRPVAIKVLPAEVAKDRARLQRFLDEARSASALNHPNVAHIYEIGESEGLKFIAMEYIEGTPLDARIDGQPVDGGELLRIASQIADALDEAHSRGVIHRDIKPQNIMLTTRGQVKVLDFGLAKARDEETAADDRSTRIKTQPGTVMGTVHYMSPEQALGRAVDNRSDIFSLGTLMYEMATGRLPFSSATSSETIDLIVHSEPPAISRFNYATAPELEFVIRKCLAKDPGSRYQSARELLIDLRNLQSGSSTLGAGQPASRRSTER